MDQAPHLARRMERSSDRSTSHGLRNRREAGACCEGRAGSNDLFAVAGTPKLMLEPGDPHPYMDKAPISCVEWDPLEKYTRGQFRMVNRELTLNG
jgi:hypothetical protein